MKLWIDYLHSSGSWLILSCLYVGKDVTEAEARGLDGQEWAGEPWKDGGERRYRYRLENR